MIHSLLMNLEMPTDWARPCLPINKDSFRLNSANKEEHQCNPFLSPEERPNCLFNVEKICFVEFLEGPPKKWKFNRVNKIV